MAKSRVPPRASKGAPNGPAGFLVSALRQGVTGTNCKAPSWVKIPVTVVFAPSVRQPEASSDELEFHPVRAHPTLGTAEKHTRRPSVKLLSEEGGFVTIVPAP